MENRESELAKLIAEQKRDDRDFQAPEPGTIPMGLLGYKDIERLTERRPRKRGGVFRRDECPIHGLSEMKAYPSEPWRPRCTRCMLDQQRARRQSDGKVDGRTREGRALRAEVSHG